MVKTLVVFRMEGDAVLAVFPHVPASHDGYDMQCFSHVGQHAACSVDYCRTTKPARPDQYAGLKRELESVPYHYKLAVRRRIPAGSFAVRRAALRAPAMESPYDES